ncbi:hypothetical protein FNV43_RR10398 [Rhamnella rubrinervis]|uniref:ABC transporter domain-containing protein n=1 Tax=Rhamnella rubrinervis TaxID=2594499 RepID=A0A8K0HBT1_9ROSA|nr:hypothetical protein FNV43_RR10398 [Rhamnella rubrinervis]
MCSRSSRGEADDEFDMEDEECSTSEEEECLDTKWTVRDSILYGKPMDTKKYENAINACALDKDINTFNHGDLSEIGQRGLNMSGGQMQRIQLARAVYNDGDIYLLDDPFSAVDAHTGATLFNDCVMTALGKKTVILVTHQVKFLSEVDKILINQLLNRSAFSSSSINLCDYCEDEKLSNDDCFLKNYEFATWLKEGKDVFFSDLSSESTCEMFSGLVKAWSNQTLESQYYEGIVSGPRTAR